MTAVSLNWETAHLYGETWISHHRLRHCLFVEDQGWRFRQFRALSRTSSIRQPPSTYCGLPTKRRAVVEILCVMQEYGIIRAAMPLRLLKRVVGKGDCQVTALGLSGNLHNLAPLFISPSPRSAHRVAAPSLYNEFGCANGSVYCRMMETEHFIFDETPEQAARTISQCLEYLRREANAIGMLDVGELIGQASKKAASKYPSSPPSVAATTSASSRT